MGIFDTLTGKSAGKAAKKAAAQRIAGINQGIGELGTSRDRVRDLFGGSISSGDNTRSRLSSIFGLEGGDGTTFEGTPGFEFARDQGLQAGERAASAGGFAGGGRAQKEAIRFATGTAQQDRGNEIARLLGFLGQNDAGRGQLAGQEESFADTIARLRAGIGEAGAGGTIGKSNAKSAGVNNLLNIAAFVGGNAINPGGNSFLNSFGGGA